MFLPFCSIPVGESLCSVCVPVVGQNELLVQYKTGLEECFQVRWNLFLTNGCLWKPP